MISWFTSFITINKNIDPSQNLSGIQSGGEKGKKNSELIKKNLKVIKIINVLNEVGQSIASNSKEHDYVMIDSKTGEVKTTNKKSEACSFQEVCNLMKNVFDSKISSKLTQNNLKNWTQIKDAFKLKKMSWIANLFFGRKKAAEVKKAEEIIQKATEKLNQKEFKIINEIKEDSNKQKATEKLNQKEFKIINEIKEDSNKPNGFLTLRNYFLDKSKEIKKNFIGYLVKEKIIKEPKAEIKFRDCFLLYSELLKKFEFNKKEEVFIQTIWNNFILELIHLEKICSKSNLSQEIRREYNLTLNEIKQFELLTTIDELIIVIGENLDELLNKANNVINKINANEKKDENIEKIKKIFEEYRNKLEMIKKKTNISYLNNINELI